MKNEIYKTSPSASGARRLRLASLDRRDVCEAVAGANDVETKGVCSPDARMYDLDRDDLSCESVFWSRAFLIRSFENQLLRLFSEGKLFGTVHTCIGQEFTGIAVASQMVEGDIIVSNHRCHGHYLAQTGDVTGLMAKSWGGPPAFAEAEEEVSTFAQTDSLATAFRVASCRLRRGGLRSHAS